MKRYSSFLPDFFSTRGLSIYPLPLDAIVRQSLIYPRHLERMWITCNRYKFKKGLGLQWCSKNIFQKFHYLAIVMHLISWTASFVISVNITHQIFFSITTCYESLCLLSNRADDPSFLAMELSHCLQVCITNEENLFLVFNLRHIYKEGLF